MPEGTIDELQGLLLGAGDPVLPPARGAPRLVVLHQEVRAAHPARLRTAPPARPLPLARVRQVVEVVDPSYRDIDPLLVTDGFSVTGSC